MSLRLIQCSTMKVLFIGRFQPFHNGHLLVLQQISKQYEEVIIGIGSSQEKDTNDNPFSEEERKLMITRSLDAVGIHNYQVAAIPDIHDPPRWVAHVCSILSGFNVVITNNPLTRKLFSEKGYLVKGTSYFDREHYSGKEIRKRILQNKPWEEFVPASVAQVMKEIQGVKQIKNNTP